MKLEYFIASKILQKSNDGKKVSKPIVKLSIISISLAIIINILTIAVVIGFKNEVSNKVLGFGSHAFVSSTNSASIFENEPILRKQLFINDIKKLPFIENVQPIAYKPAILQSHKSNIKTQEIQSVLIKGVDASYNFNFFKEYLIAGRLPKYKNNVPNDEILISKKIAQDLHYEVGDIAAAFFVKNQPTKRNFKIVGIFETGMEDLDKKIVLANLHNIQELNDWGIKANIVVLDTLYNNQLVIKADVAGGNGNYRFDWGKGFDRFAGFTWLPNKDTTFRLIASDYWTNIDGRNENNSIPDTAYLSVKLNTLNYGEILKNKDGTIQKEVKNQDGTKFTVKTSKGEIQFELKIGKGSFSQYVGAYEFNFKSWDNFDEHVNYLKKMINFNYSNEYQDITVNSIKENQKDIFVWLSFLDINVYIILTLMIIIGIINMGSALLVIILVRTSFIGMLMAMGASNWTIRKIFLIQVFFLIFKGMLWGNVIALGIYFIQLQFGVFKLNPEVYYLNKVPVELTFWSFILINLVTIIVCLLAMIIPSYIITKIKPSQAIKFS